MRLNGIERYLSTWTNSVLLMNDRKDLKILLIQEKILFKNI